MSGLHPCQLRGHATSHDLAGGGRRLRPDFLRVETLTSLLTALPNNKPKRFDLRSRTRGATPT